VIGVSIARQRNGKNGWEKKGCGEKEGRKRNLIRTVKVMPFSFCGLPWHCPLSIPVREWG
jgi:hypothetical protein